MNANSELPALNRFIIGKYRAETVWKSVPRVAGSRGHRLPVVSGRGSRRNDPKLPFNLLPFCQLATETECPLEELQARERVGLALELVSLPQGRNTGQKKEVQWAQLRQVLWSVCKNVKKLARWRNLVCCVAVASPRRSPRNLQNGWRRFPWWGWGCKQGSSH